MEYLTEEQVRPLLSWDTLIPAVESALRDLSLGTLRQPVRSVMPVPEHHGLLGLMPAAAGDLMAVKLVAVYEGNAALPTHQAVIQLFSARTGEPLLAMDGRLITEMRTAAVSALAVRLLAPPAARVLAILGSGVQAHSHIEALRRVWSFGEIRVWSRTPAHAARFAREHAAIAFPTAESAVRGADIVLSVSSVRALLVQGAWLGHRTLVCAVGAVGPDRRELDDAAMQAAIVVESREAALRESADLIATGQPIHAELGELLAGLRPLPQGRVLFKSLGVAAADLAAARLVFERRREPESGI